MESCHYSSNSSTSQMLLEEDRKSVGRCDAIFTIEKWYGPQFQSTQSREVAPLNRPRRPQLNSDTILFRSVVACGVDLRGAEIIAAVESKR